MAQKVYKLTRERYAELEEDLNYSKTVREKEVAEQIKIARAFGDLSENSEYDEAKNEQGKLYSRIAEIEDILAHAIIIDEDGAVEMVEVGTVVTFESGGRELTYKVVGSNEANPAEKRISDESPIGKALVGAKIGSQVSYEAPNGAVVKCVVKAISR